MNLDRARAAIDSVISRGVTDFCVCSGSRNAPLLAVLAMMPNVVLHSFVDERSASFFAIGIAKRQQRPVCVVTTSGTAVAELLPAAVEAWYSATPLILLTADRPARFRGTGAPQAIEQVAIFGPYAARSLESWNGASALHMNIAFDEPLIDGDLRGGFRGPVPAPPDAVPSEECAGVGIPFERPLLIAGGLAAGDRERVRQFALQMNSPVYAEPLSGLREDEMLRELLVTSERMMTRGAFDGVVRLGNVPTLRFWRDLDENLSSMPVISFSRLPFAGLSRGDVHPFGALVANGRRERDIEFFAMDRDMRGRLDRIIDAEPQSELAMMRSLSQDLPPLARVYLGNSLPIREWDLVATREARGYDIEANRGANGIDGQLSTFFGWCQRGRTNVAILGDLTVLYDLGAPWICAHLDAGFRIVVVNNSGGRIFDRVPALRALPEDVRSRVIDNAHTLAFASWAEMWKIGYAWASRDPVGHLHDDVMREVLELVPDLEASRRVWTRYDELWRD